MADNVERTLPPPPRLRRTSQRARTARVIATSLLCVMAAGVSAQRGGGAAPAAPQTPQASAPIDITGYWVSIVNEDWRWRMVTPPKGDYASVPISPEGRKVADTWDASKDGSCLAFGAANVMRMPTRLHITWENENTLKIDTDNGQQTRRLVFNKSSAPPAAKSLQGYSVAEWERPAPAGRGGGGGGGQGAAPAAAPVAPRFGNLKVVTTQLSGGWLRRNGVPYSEDTTMTEFFDRFAAPDKAEWLVVTTIVNDPKYLAQDFVTSTHFRREPGNAKWDPVPCKPI
jgi:hypothetical protein